MKSVLYITIEYYISLNVTNCSVSLVRSNHSIDVDMNRVGEQLTSNSISQVENVIESDHPFAGEETGNRVSRRGVLLSVGLLDARLHRLLGRPSSGRYHFGRERRGRKQGAQQFRRRGYPS